MKQMVLNSNQIQEVIPHRHPFLLVDRIDELEVGKRAVGVKCVTAGDPYFQDIFLRNTLCPAF